ncbi:phage holin family protein [Olsenella urininfantis]|uniref:phage holin family protein n=1 Tax=Olsenella urininfantis TaxID=1871033 RepID=UPI000986A0E3|nr:phage holin family protein [Olsenella urininfantis]
MNGLPIYIDVFLAPIRDSQPAQVALGAVLLTIMLDWVLGTACAVLRHDYSSEVARRGIAHKATELCFVLLGVIIDGTIAGGLNIGIGEPVLVGCCAYIVIMELASALETIGAANPNLARSPLFRVLRSVSEAAEKGEA